LVVAVVVANALAKQVAQGVVVVELAILLVDLMVAELWDKEIMVV
jgi:hypothetical protein